MDRYNYDIISDDALFVGSSPAVRFLIAVLRYLRNPEDPDKQEIGDVCLSSINRKIWGERGGRVCFSKPSVYLPAILVRGNRRATPNFSAYFPETEQVFVQAFLDMVSEYAQKKARI